MKDRRNGERDGAAWQQDLVAGLLDPAAYPWRPATVEVIETHISWVFLAGDRVVKVKRPVAYGFVDHRPPASRELSCREEVRLNRRLSNGVYLGVVAIAETAAGPRVDGKGEVVEWATLMRRLPHERMVDALLAAGAAPTDLADRLADRLIPFHRAIAAECGQTPFGSAETTAGVLIDNLAELRPFAGPVLAPLQLSLVERAMREFLAAQRPLLAARAASGLVRDGHGDLRCEHICDEGDGAIQIFDCIEFNPAIRCVDVASDLAFLLMDLDRLGAPAVAQTLLRRYREAGADLPEPLVRLFRAHRALVRAKVDCLTITAGGEEPGALIPRAVDHLDLATAAALTVRPALIVMTGLSGTGKSTVARRLARALGMPLIASDVVRKELAGVAGPAAAEWGEGIYQPEITDATYRELFARAERSLAAGESVVLDATFLAAEQRQRAATVAAGGGVPLVIVETVCDEAVVEARLVARGARGDSPSDATIAIHRRQRAAAEAAPAAMLVGAIAAAVDTSDEGPVILDPVLRALVAAGIVVVAIE